MKAAILANGELRYPQQVLILANGAEFLIAANGGSRHARVLGLQPHLVVGDLDSLSASERRWLRMSGAELVQHPAEKDETDLELALLQAVQRKATDIVVLAALGGRTDQMLANILLLALPQLQDVHACLVDGVETIFLIHDQVQIAGAEGDLLSLIPIGGDCHGIWTTGLAYPLAGSSLWLSRARGISNAFTTTWATIRVSQGTLLAVHRAKDIVTRWPQTSH